MTSIYSTYLQSNTRNLYPIDFKFYKDDWFGYSQQYNQFTSNRYYAITSVCAIENYKTDTRMGFYFSKRDSGNLTGGDGSLGRLYTNTENLLVKIGYSSNDRASGPIPTSAVQTNTEQMNRYATEQGVYYLTNGFTFNMYGLPTMQFPPNFELFIPKNARMFTDESACIKYVLTGIDDEHILDPLVVGIDWELYWNSESKNPLWYLTWKPQEGFENFDSGEIVITYQVRDTDGEYKEFIKDQITVSVDDDYNSNLVSVRNLPHISDWISSHPIFDKLEDVFYKISMWWLLPNERRSSIMSVEFNDVDIATDSVKNEGLDASTLTIKRGIPTDDDFYTPPNEESDNISRSQGYNILTLLTTTYCMDVAHIQSLGNELWQSNFIDNLKLVNNNPIENVIGVKYYPFAITEGEWETIKIGNVDMGTQGVKVPRTYEQRMTIGTITIPLYYSSFLDYAPFTKIDIFLPFVGYKTLDTSFVMGRTLSVELITDIITGACKYILYSDGVQFSSFDGSIGIDIPLTSSNRAQVEMSYIQSALGVVTNTAIGNYGGALADALNGAQTMYHSQTNGTASPSINCYETFDIFLIYDRPTYQELKQFNHTHGKKCNLSKTIFNLSGYTVAYNVDTSGIQKATETEKEMIKEILESGFYA